MSSRALTEPVAETCTKQEWLLAKKLIDTVMRAFYSDTAVVIMDALQRDSCIPKEEIGPRLKIPNKDVDMVLNRLVDEDHLVSKESVQVNGSIVVYYYIDYQHCVDVIRYRIHLMTKLLQKQSKDSHQLVEMQCPTCLRTFSDLEAQALMCKDNCFGCSYCGPTHVETFGDIMSEPRFRLRAVDTTNKIESVEDIQKKLTKQLTRELPYREGVFDLLRELQHVQLPQNLPSYQILSGTVTTNVRVDERTLKAIKHNYAKSAAIKGGGSKVRKRDLEGIASTGQGFAEEEDEEVEIFFGEDDDRPSGPSFIVDDDINHVAAQRTMQDGDAYEGANLEFDFEPAVSDEQPAKKSRIEESNLAEAKDDAEIEIVLGEAPIESDEDDEIVEVDENDFS